MRDTAYEPPGPAPIFIGYTRSFWLGILPTLVLLVDVVIGLAADPVAGPPVAALVATLFGLDAAKVETTMRALAPFFALVIAQQRAGAARPYTFDPRAQ